MTSSFKKVENDADAERFMRSIGRQIVSSYKVQLSPPMLKALQPEDVAVVELMPFTAVAVPSVCMLGLASSLPGTNSVIESAGYFDLNYLKSDGAVNICEAMLAFVDYAKAFHVGQIPVDAELQSYILNPAFLYGVCYLSSRPNIPDADEWTAQAKEINQIIFDLAHCAMHITSNSCGIAGHGAFMKDSLDGIKQRIAEFKVSPDAERVGDGVR